MSSSTYPVVTSSTAAPSGYYQVVPTTTVTSTTPVGTGHPLDGAKQVAAVEPKNSSSYKTVGIIIGIVIIIIIMFLLFTYVFGWGKGGTKGTTCSKLNDPSCSGGTTCSGNRTCEPTGSLVGTNQECTSSANCYFGDSCQQQTNGNGTTGTGKYVCTPGQTIFNNPTNRTPATVHHTTQSESNTFRSTAPTPINTNTSNNNNNNCCCSWSPHNCPVHRRNSSHHGHSRHGGYW